MFCDNDVPYSIVAVMNVTLVEALRIQRQRSKQTGSLSGNWRPLGSVAFHGQL
jgi:hypothetical protein